MTDNTLDITIEAPIQTVYDFTITPPNSTLWIEGVIEEEADPWPLRIGTTYTLVSDDESSFKVKVIAFEDTDFVEWISEDRQYHCRYTYHANDPLSTQLTYHEWVDSGEIEDPFEHTALQRLKTVIETQ